MSAESFAPSVMMKLMKEIRSLHDSPIDGITVSHTAPQLHRPPCTASPSHTLTPTDSTLLSPAGTALQLLVSDESLSSVHAELDGPVGTPFEGGRFRVRLSLPSDYPQSPPKGYFLTKVFHPNVSGSGEICVNTLKKDWKASHGLRHVLLVVHCLLIQPNPESALNEEAGRLLMEAYEEYDRRARLMTRIHATVKGKEAKQPMAAVAAAASPSAASEKPRNVEGSAAAGAVEGEVNEEDLRGQENTPTPSASPNRPKAALAAAEGKRAGSGGAEKAGEEESKAAAAVASINKRPAVVAMKGGEKPDKAKAVKKSIKRL